MRAWVSEAKKVPPCFDSSGKDGSGWVGFSCQAAKQWCTDPTDKLTPVNCPVTCGTCPSGLSGSVGLPSTNPPTPAPTLPPPPTECKDSDTYKDSYFGDTCASWIG